MFIHYAINIASYWSGNETSANQCVHGAEDAGASVRPTMGHIQISTSNTRVFIATPFLYHPCLTFLLHVSFHKTPIVTSWSWTYMYCDVRYGITYMLSPFFARPLGLGLHVVKGYL